MELQPPRMDADRPVDARSSSRRDLLHARVTHEVIGAFYAVYNELGYGFLESVYRNALALELTGRGVAVECEVPVTVRYGGQEVGHFRADLLVEKRVVLELKACRSIGAPDRQQLLNYLRGTGLELGLLLHFGPRASFIRVVRSQELRPPRSDPRKSPFRSA